MERKKRNPGLNPEHPDVEVLKLARALPRTMKSRLHLNLLPATIEESLIYCLNSFGSEIGEYLVDNTEYHYMLRAISSELANNNAKCGILFTGSYGTGKTTIMQGLRKLLDLLKEVPSAWEYQEINSLDNAYIRAEDFLYPIASYEKFCEAAAAPILFLDNLGIESDTPKDDLAITLIKNLIRLRYDMRMFTLIGTPFDARSIREVYGNQIASIIANSYSIIELDWMPFRKNF